MKEPPATQSATATHVPKHRIGLVLAGLGDANVDALRFIVLQINGLQATFEVEFLPWLQDGFLVQLRLKDQLDREKIKAEAPAFAERYKAFLISENHRYTLKEVPPDYIVVISLACFRDGYYSARHGPVSIIALGNWKKLMAPPSILEFILTLVLREALASISHRLRGSQHLGTKGCLCDFTANLDEVRMKVLSAFLCAHCSQSLVSDGFPSLPDEVKHVLGKQWLGKIEEPNSPAAIVAKLGYNLFVTKGLKATPLERTLATLQEEGVKELVKVVGLVVGAALILWLGLKAAV